MAKKDMQVDKSISKDVVKTLGDTQKAALGRAPAMHIGILQMAFIVGSICLATGDILLYKEQYISRAGWGTLVLKVH